MTCVFLLTEVVFTLKVTDWLPAGTMIVGGTDALVGLLLDSVTWKPPEDAGALSVTVPTELFPPRTLVGFRVKADSAAGGWGLTVKDVDLELLL